jgi:hypothetical protein
MRRCPLFRPFAQERESSVAERFEFPPSRRRAEWACPPLREDTWIGGACFNSSRGESQFAPRRPAAISALRHDRISAHERGLYAVEADNVTVDSDEPV